MAISTWQLAKTKSNKLWWFAQSRNRTTMAGDLKIHRADHTDWTDWRDRKRGHAGVEKRFVIWRMISGSSAQICG